ncbi:MAG: MAPEG family protein [Halioglobus sp.]
MSVELSMLVYSVLLFLVIILVQAGMAITQNGAVAQAGSRDGLPEPSTLRKRLQRLTANMQENLLMFAIVVLVANSAGVSNATTILGASLFFYARVAHAIVYAFGWPMVRPIWSVRNSHHRAGNPVAQRRRQSGQ